VIGCEFAAFHGSRRYGQIALGGEDVFQGYRNLSTAALAAPAAAQSTPAAPAIIRTLKPGSGEHSSFLHFLLTAANDLN